MCCSCDEHIVNLTLRNIHLKQGGPWLCDDVVSLPALPCTRTSLSGFPQALVCGQENVVVDDVPLWPEGSTCKPSADVGSGRGAALSPTKTIAPVIHRLS